MSEQPQRPVQQDVDLKQTNDQKTEQANTQDASHQSSAEQDVAVHGYQTQIDRSQVRVTVHNQMLSAGALLGRLHVQVSDLNGAGVAGCTAELFFGPLVGIPFMVTGSDAMGRLQAPDLPPGFYGLRVVTPGGGIFEQSNLRVNPGGESRTIIVLPESAPQTQREPLRWSAQQPGA